MLMLSMAATLAGLIAGNFGFLALFFVTPLIGVMVMAGSSAPFAV